jgi:raffinose/stachyose/melibiose transport system substrate-binding protein
MRKPRIGVVLTAAVLLIAGCSDPSVESGDDGAAADTTGNGATTEASGALAWPEPTSELDGVSLTMWTAQNTAQAADQVIEAFEAATGATVDTTVVPDPYEQGVQTQVATGDLPDLAFWQPTGSMLTALQAPNNLQSLDGAPWLNEMDPAVRDITGILGDTRYAALVTTPAVMGVYYNRDIFEEVGITEVPGNWDELIDVARQIDEAGHTAFHEAGGDRWPTQWWVQVQLADEAQDGFWERMNANEASFTDPVVVDAITTYQELIQEGLFNDDIRTATFEDQGDAFLAGDAAMVLQVNTFLNQLQTKASTEELNEMVGWFPISPSGNVGTSIPDQSNAVVAFTTGDEQREAAARQFLAFWMGPDNEDFVTARDTVSLKSDVPTPDSVPQVAIDIHDSLAESVGSMQSLAIANPDLYLNLADMIYEEKTPEQVAQATQEQFEQLARAQGAPGF